MISSVGNNILLDWQFGYSETLSAEPRPVVFLMLSTNHCVLFRFGTHYAVFLCLPEAFNRVHHGVLIHDSEWPARNNPGSSQKSSCLHSSLPYKLVHSADQTVKHRVPVGAVLGPLNY